MWRSKWPWGAHGFRAGNCRTAAPVLVAAPSSRAPPASVERQGIRAARVAAMIIGEGFSTEFKNYAASIAVLRRQSCRADQNRPTQESSPLWRVAYCLQVDGSQTVA